MISKKTEDKEPLKDKKFLNKKNKNKEKWNPKNR